MLRADQADDVFEIRDQVIERSVGKGMFAAVVLLELLRFIAMFIQTVRIEVNGSHLIHRFMPLPRFLAHKARTKIDLDDTAVFRQRLDHFIAHVALPAGCEMPRGRVGGDHRGLADFKHLVKSFIGHMGYVDHDAQPVHLGNHLFAERTQAVPFSFLVVGRIGNVVTQCMRQGDVRNTPVMEKRQVFQLAVNRRTVLHAHRQADQAVLHRFLRIVGGFDDCKFPGRTAHQCLYAIDQLVGQCVAGALLFCFRWRVNGHEWNIQATAAGTLVVEVTVPGAFCYIHPVVEQTVRYIDMRIDNYRPLGKHAGGHRELSFFC